MGSDLRGRRFGKLTVLSLEVASPCSHKRWRCQCDCGNYCSRLESTLRRAKRDRRISSCGCFIKKYLTAGDSARCSKAGLHRKDSFMNGSNIQMTLREGTITTNTSGCQGVSWSKTARKWHCFIGYQSYRANLGFYEDINDAIRIRKLAEEAIKNNEFEDFFYSIRGRHLGEKENKQFKEGRRKNLT